LNGGDSFTFRAHDGLTTGNVATVTINVTPVNDPPIAVNDSTNTLEDASVTVNVLANDSDLDGTPLTLTGTSTTNGTAVISGTSVVFTPSSNFNGVVVFNYTVSDGTNSANANVTVTVTPVNDAPGDNNDTYTTLEDVPLIVPPPAGILTNDVDVDGDVLTAVIVSDVTHGTLSLNADGSFTYTPNTNYNGSDSFTYRATDGLATGNVATVTINLTPVSDPLKFTSQRMTANGFQLQVSGPHSSTYVILASTNLRNWTPICTSYTALGSMTFTDTSATNNPVRFYRVEAR
jgi:VCBS repeat-containing protein